MQSDLTLVGFFDDEDDPATCAADANPARAPSSNNDEDDGDEVVLEIEGPSVGKAGGSPVASSEILSRGRDVLLTQVRVNGTRGTADKAGSRTVAGSVWCLRRRERNDTI